MDNHPGWQDGIVLIQFASTFNENLDEEHVRYSRQVHELATTINAMYGSVSSMPVQVHATTLSQDDYFAIIRLGDVALYTSIREGMSTTGLEYVACQRQKNGVLMLSEFSYTADNLNEAIHVNFWDI